jgi:hypothetical protein
VMRSVSSANVRWANSSMCPHGLAVSRPHSLSPVVAITKRCCWSGRIAARSLEPARMERRAPWEDDAHHDRRPIIGGGLRSTLDECPFELTSYGSSRERERERAGSSV